MSRRLTPTGPRRDRHAVTDHESSPNAEPHGEDIKLNGIFGHPFGRYRNAHIRLNELRAFGKTVTPFDMAKFHFVDVPATEIDADDN